MITPSVNVRSDTCTQRKFRSICAFVQYDQKPRMQFLHPDNKESDQNVRFLTLRLISTVIDLITAHAPISAQSSNLVVLAYFYQLLYKSICCGYSFELSRLVEAIQTSTHNKCFRKENQNITSHMQHLICSL